MRRLLFLLAPLLVVIALLFGFERDTSANETPLPPAPPPFDESSLPAAATISTPVPLPNGTSLCPDNDPLFYGDSVLLPLNTPLNPAGGHAALWRVYSSPPFTTELKFLPGALACGVGVMTTSTPGPDIAVLPTEGYLNVIPLNGAPATSYSLPNRLRTEVDAQVSPVGVGGPGPSVLVPVVGGLYIRDLSGGTTNVIPIPTDIVPGDDLAVVASGQFALLPTNGYLYKINVASQQISATIQLTRTGLLVPEVDILLHPAQPVVYVPVRDAIDAININTMTRVWSTALPSAVIMGSDLRLRSDNQQLLMPTIAHLSFLNPATGAIASTPLAGRLRAQSDVYYAVANTRAVVPVAPAGGADSDYNLDIFNTATFALAASPIISGDIEMAVDVGFATDTMAVMPTMGYIQFVDLNSGTVVKTLAGGRLRIDIDLLVMPGGGKAAFATSSFLYLLNGVPANSALLPMANSIRQIDLVAQTQSILLTTGADMIGVDAVAQSNAPYFDADEDMACWVCYPLKTPPPLDAPPWVDNRGQDPLESLTVHVLANNDIVIVDQITGQVIDTLTNVLRDNRPPAGPIEIDALNQIAIIPLQQPPSQPPAAALIDLWRIANGLPGGHVHIVTFAGRPIWRPLIDSDNGWAIWRLEDGGLQIVDEFNGGSLTLPLPANLTLGQPVMDAVNKRIFVRTKGRCVFVIDLLFREGHCLVHPNGAAAAGDPVLDYNTGDALIPYRDGKLAYVNIANDLYDMIDPTGAFAANQSNQPQAAGSCTPQGSLLEVIAVSHEFRRATLNAGGCPVSLDVQTHSLVALDWQELPQPQDWFFAARGVTSNDDWEMPISRPSGQTKTPDASDVSIESLEIQHEGWAFTYQKIEWTLLSNRNDPTQHAIVAQNAGGTTSLLNAPSALSTTVALIGPGQTWWQTLNPGKIVTMQYEPHKQMLVVVAENGVAVFDLWNIAKRWADGGFNVLSFDQAQGHFKWYPNVQLFGTGHEFAGMRLDWLNDWILMVTHDVSNTNRYDFAILDMDTFYLGPNGVRINTPRFAPVVMNSACGATTCMRGPWWWYFNPWNKVVQFYRLDGKLLTLGLWPWLNRAPDASNPYKPADLSVPIVTTLASSPLVVSDVIAPAPPPTTSLRLLSDPDNGLVGISAPPGSVEPYATVHVVNTSALSYTLSTQAPSKDPNRIEVEKNFYRIELIVSSSSMARPDGGFGRGPVSLTHAPASVDPDTFYVGAEPGDTLAIMVCDVAGNCSAPETVVVSANTYLPVITR